MRSPTRLDKRYKHKHTGILQNKAKLELVHPMVGEFFSHRVHLLSLQAALQPSIFTRLLILVVQVGIQRALERIEL